MFADAQGHTRLVIDGAGNATALSYDAFGLEMGSAATAVNHRYTGEYFDQDSGLYHLRARDYDPSIGRFISMDEHPGSQQIPLTLNKYLYGNADPVNHVDPSGNFGISSAISGISATMSVMSAFAIGWESGSIINRVRAGESLMSSSNLKSAAGIALAMLPIKYLPKVHELADVARIFESAGLQVKIYDKTQKGFASIYHFIQRLHERKILPEDALKAIMHGDIYRDKKSGAIVRVLGANIDGTVKVIIDKGVIVTAYTTKLTAKFIPL